MVCRQLNMEESVAEIMNQLGADESGKISFQDFIRCRMQLVREIRKEEVGLSEKSDNSCKKKQLRDRIASWPTSSDNSLGRYNRVLPWLCFLVNESDLPGCCRLVPRLFLAALPWMSFGYFSLFCTVASQLLVYCFSYFSFSLFQA